MMTKRQMVAALAATYDRPAEWERYYQNWSNEALRRQLAAREAFLARK